MYNSCSGSLNPLTWGEFKKHGIASWEKYPTVEMMWYPGLNFSVDPFFYGMQTILYHHVPAFVLDLAARLSGKKPFLVSISSSSVL